MTTGTGSGAKRSALLLLRTPLQAWIAQQVLIAESVTEYELLYFTQNDSPEDRRYFSRLAAEARFAKYCHAPLRRFDILGHLNFRLQAKNWFRNRSFDLTLLSSLNSLVINAISCKQASSELVTFDDGFANILPTSMFYVHASGWRDRLYRKLLGTEDLDSIKKRILRHYTIYPQFSNVVNPQRLRVLEGFKDSSRRSDQTDTVTYFIGQPFHEAMPRKHVNMLQDYFRTLDIDVYVRHPRETQPLDIGAPYLEKNGLIAEESIVQNAGDRSIHLVGWFSSVSFNLGGIASRRTMCLISSADGSELMAGLAAQAGCDVVLI